MRKRLTVLLILIAMTASLGGSALAINTTPDTSNKQPFLNRSIPAGHPVKGQLVQKPALLRPEPKNVETPKPTFSTPIGKAKTTIPDYAPDRS